MRLSPVLAELEQYPFTRLDEWRAGRDLIDFGVGDPREVTPAFIREALASAIGERSSYPRAAGLPELRAAIRSWIERRYEVEVEDRELLPTLGSKEAIFSFAQVVLGEKRGVAVPEPGYPVYERGARFAGGTVVPVPLREENGWLPDLDAFDGWDELALFWVCYPNNPTGATAPLAFYEELAGLAREHGFLVCSDEAYSELWFDQPPASALPRPPVNGLFAPTPLRPCPEKVEPVTMPGASTKMFSGPKGSGAFSLPGGAYYAAGISVARGG